MNTISHIEGIIRLGGCVVLGIGVTPEKYRMMLQIGSEQDYIIIGPKDSDDANLIAARMNDEKIAPRAISVLGLEMDAYVVKK